MFIIIGLLFSFSYCSIMHINVGSGVDIAFVSTVECSY